MVSIFLNDKIANAVSILNNNNLCKLVSLNVMRLVYKICISFNWRPLG